MIRAFGLDCIDISEPNNDGWLIAHNLVASMCNEQSGMADTAAVWATRQLKSKIFIAFGTNTVWHGLQHAVRALLLQEHETQVLHHLLHLDQEHQEIQSHVSAIGHWLALRASERDLLAMVLQCGQYLRINGFDSFEGVDSIGKRQMVLSMPDIYNDWAKQLPRSIENVKRLVEAELKFLLEELSIDRESLVRCIQKAIDKPPDLTANTQYKCLSCYDDYVSLGTGLVQPRRISFNECRITEHKFYCQCTEFLRALGVMQGRPVADSGDIDDVDVDEEYFKETEGNVDQLCEEYDRLSLDEKRKGDLFHDAATILYRTQGRRWIGSYEPSELLCATCFLESEEYINHGFTPVPKTFISSCPSDNFTSTF
jgi:hypothetical protein